MTKKTESTPRQGPSHIVWFVPEREHAPWTRIGAAWPTKTGKGFRMSLELVPMVPGSTLILPHEAREGEGA
jgi:hypothetical protein